MADEDVTPEVPGHAEPDVGGGEGVESEIPVGVDSLTDEQLAKAEEAGPADGGGDDEGDGGALDVSALMDDSGDDAGDDAAADDGGDDADATADDDVAEPDNSGEEA